jgi:nicotinamidase/pyrazinamidase
MTATHSCQEKTMPLPFEPSDALLLVDVQVDFCPGGSLPIPQGDTVVPVLNRWLEAAATTGIAVVASRDWHPPHHVSFEPQGGPWPVHCVQHTPGAAFHPDLALPNHTIVISKAETESQEAYSAFDGTGLAQRLRDAGIRRLWVGGLAEDVCVKATVLEALREGFEVRLIEGGMKPVTESGGQQARELMFQAGAQPGTLG